MRTKLTIFFLLCLCTLSYAQKPKSASKRIGAPYQKQFLMEVKTGANIDFIKNSSDPYAAFLGSRKKTAPMLNYKFTHLFAPKVGWYANVQFSIYKEREPESEQSIIGDILEDIAKAFFLDHLSKIHPTVEAGFTYRIEGKRWRVYPQAGIGYTVYMSNKSSSQSIAVGDREETGRYKRKATPFFASAGLSANYFLSRKFYLSANTNFQQPLKKSYTQFTYTENGEVTDSFYYKTTTAGRSLNVSAGAGICF